MTHRVYKNDTPRQYLFSVPKVMANPIMNVDMRINFNELARANTEKFDWFEYLGPDPVFGLPMIPLVCKARRWTQEEAAWFVGANVAHIRDTTMYVSKTFDHDTGLHFHKMVNKPEILATLSNFSFYQTPKESGEPRGNIEGKNLLKCIPVYTKVIFDPGCPNPKTGERRAKNMDPIYRPYNSFKGLQFKFNPEFIIPIDKVGLFRQHALEVLCNKNETLFNYLEIWIAHLFQHPASKPGTALCFISEQGAGKNVFWNVIMDIITPAYCVSVIQREHMQGQFNNHLANKLFVLCDEVTWGGCHETNSLMKARITQPNMMLEKKGCDAYNISAYERYVVLSNEAWPIKVEQTDRRWAIYDVSSSRIDDRSYFDRFIAFYKDRLSMEAIYHYYMNVSNVPETLPRPPEGEAKDALRGISRTDEAQFLCDLLEHTNGCERMTYIQEGTKVTTAGLYSLFQDWITENGHMGKRQNVTRRLFGVNITRLLGNSKAARAETITRWNSISTPQSSVAKAYTISKTKILA